MRTSNLLKKSISADIMYQVLKTHFIKIMYLVFWKPISGFFVSPFCNSCLPGFIHSFIQQLQLSAKIRGPTLSVSLNHRSKRGLAEKVSMQSCEENRCCILQEVCLQHFIHFESLQCWQPLFPPFVMDRFMIEQNVRHVTWCERHTRGRYSAESFPCLESTQGGRCW